LKGPTKKTEAEAIAAWNHRPVEDAKDARIKELEAKLAALEQWQKEAVEELKACRAMFNLMNYHPNTIASNRIEVITNLIKQAEGE
jgi:hypothetical protein